MLQNPYITNEKQCLPPSIDYPHPSFPKNVSPSLSFLKWNKSQPPIKKGGSHYEYCNAKSVKCKVLFFRMLILIFLIYFIWIYYNNYNLQRVSVTCNESKTQHIYAKVHEKILNYLKKYWQIPEMAPQKLKIAPSKRQHPCIVF